MGLKLHFGVAVFPLPAFGFAREAGFLQTLGGKELLLRAADSLLGFCFLFPKTVLSTH
jgi:hypothetical protein